MTETAHTPDFEVSADIPEKWGDRTVIVYADHSGEDKVDVAANIAISRDARGAEETFTAYVNRQVNSLVDGIDGFTLIHRREGKMQGRPATDISCTWPGPGDDLRQRYVYIDAGKPRIACFVATAEAPVFERHEPVFNEVLASLTITPLDGSEAR